MAEKNPLLPELLQKAENLPLLPGVYMMLDKKSEIIYVGKAKKLRNRVSSYFHGDHLPKVSAMIEKVNDFHVIIAASEFEALVLENSLIKRHKPHYNILLKDDKGYPYIRIDRRQEYPTISVSARSLKDGASYYGPFGTRKQTFEIIAELKKALLLPDCSRKFPRDIGKERPCLNYQMNQCAGWCRQQKTADEYRELIELVVKMLTGHSSELVSYLKKQIEAAAEELNFELAAQLRDRMLALERVTNRQKVVSTAMADTDALGFFRGSPSCLAVLHFVNGDLVGKDAELFAEPVEEDPEALSEMIQQYYTGHRGGWPKSILVPFDLDDRDNLEQMLSELSGRRIYIERPQRGDRASLVRSAAANAREEVLRRLSEQEKGRTVLSLLQRTLGLEQLPVRIEAYDISNLGSKGIVSAMTVFEDAKPKKSAYRKFRIRDLDGPDDYQSMYQTICRRVDRFLNGDEAFSPLPDLFLIDGGSTHAATAERALQERGLRVPVLGMVKDDRHRTRALINSAGKEVDIRANQALFSFIGMMQEETHRTAITYQKQLRKESFQSELDSIPGIGERRRQDLLKAFKSADAIRNASVEQLQLVLPKKTAQEVFYYFHRSQEN